MELTLQVPVQYCSLQHGPRFHQAEYLNVTRGGMQASPERVLSVSRVLWLEVLAASWAEHMGYSTEGRKEMVPDSFFFILLK